MGRHPVRFFAIALTFLTAFWVLAAAPEEEVVHGKIRVAYTQRGYIKIFYGDLEVARKFMMYRHNYDRDNRMSFHFPGRGKPGGFFAPGVVALTDKDGNRIGTMITWNINPPESPSEMLDPNEDNFVRVTVSATQVKVHFRAEGAFPSMKATGQVSFLTPEETFRGGTYSAITNWAKATIAFPPPGVAFERLGGMRDGYTLETTNGLQMVVEPSDYKINLMDYRHRGGDEKNTWWFLTSAKSHIDWAATLTFKEPAARTEAE